jgi:putative ABC transport system substrate-binding protein
MRRRHVITLFGGAVAAWPLAVLAQPTIPVVGFLHSGSAAPNAHLASAFLRGLSETGFDVGRNIAVEYRWAEGRYDLLHEMATDLASRGIAVIYAAGGSVSAIEAKKAAKTIPLVFVMGSDPVRVGLVASLNRPGSNATGVTLITTGLEAKRLELLRQLVPSAAVIAALINRDNPNATDITNDLRAAASSLGIEAHLLHAASDAELGRVLATLPQLQVNGVLVANDPFFLSRRDKIVAEIARYSLPAIYHSREFPAAGGLASYGSNLVEMYRKSGVYVGRILKGDKPADLPVQQPTAFELVINSRTAKSLGLIVPSSIVATADEVIE